MTEMGVRVSVARSRVLRATNHTTFASKGQIAITGYFTSWLIHADICPKTLSLPA